MLVFMGCVEKCLKKKRNNKTPQSSRMKLFEFLSVIPYILKTEMKIYKTYPVEEKKSQTTIIIELYKIKT